MPYSIEKDFAFSASHRLEGLPEDHQCARMHGHNYVVRISLEGLALQDVGFLFDYGDLKPFKDWIDDTLDHRHLNDLMAENPTAENLAHVLAHTAAEACHIPDYIVVSCGVSETPKTWAWWTP